MIVIDLLLGAAAALLFWQEHPYFSIVLFLIQIILAIQWVRTEGLLGGRTEVIPVSRKLKALFMVSVLGFLAVWGAPEKFDFEWVERAQTAEELTRVYGGELLPGMVLVLALISLLVFGLSLEGRRR